MSKTRWFWILAIGALAAVDLITTLHATESWRRKAAGPSVTTLRQVAGWGSTVVLAVVLLLLIASGVAAALRTRRASASGEPDQAGA